MAGDELEGRGWRGAMIRKPHIPRAHEDDPARRTPPDHLGNLRLAEAMPDVVRQFCVWPPADPLLPLSSMTHATAPAGGGQQTSAGRGAT
jgi:hypothetical protein